MTFDDVLFAYAEGLDAEIAILRQVDALAVEQRTAWARNELLPLGSLATRRAALMHELAATETRIAPLRDRLRSDLGRARRTPGYPRAEALSQEAQALIRTLMAADRKFLTDLEASLDARRREVGPAGRPTLGHPPRGLRRWVGGPRSRGGRGPARDMLHRDDDRSVGHRRLR